MVSILLKELVPLLMQSILSTLDPKVLLRSSSMQIIKTDSVQKSSNIASRGLSASRSAFWGSVLCRKIIHVFINSGNMRIVSWEKDSARYCSSTFPKADSLFASGQFSFNFRSQGSHYEMCSFLWRLRLLSLHILLFLRRTEWSKSSGLRSVYKKWF